LGEGVQPSIRQQIGFSAVLTKTSIRMCPPVLLLQHYENTSTTRLLNRQIVVLSDPKVAFLRRKLCFLLESCIFFKLHCIIKRCIFTNSQVLQWSWLNHSCL